MEYCRTKAARCFYGTAMVEDMESPAPSQVEEGNDDRPVSTSVGESHDTAADARQWVTETARFRRRVAAYTRRTVRDPDEVDDLLAETWASAWYEHVTSPAALPNERLLIAHARVACSKWQAARRREVELPSSGLASSLRTDAEDLKQQIEDEYSQTLDWMRELPQQQHYTLVFRLLRGSKLEMVAAAIGCNVSTAKTHYWRGIEALRRRRLARIKASRAACGFCVTCCLDSGILMPSTPSKFTSERDLHTCLHHSDAVPPPTGEVTMRRRFPSLISARRARDSITMCRQSVARLLVAAVVALLAACNGDAPDPTSPPRPNATRSQEVTAGTTTNGSTLGDPLSRWLPNTPGACLIATRTADGRFPSRSSTIPLPGGLNSSLNRTARFAYRGWKAGVAEPVLLAVCTIPDTPGAREYLSTRFGGRAINAGELRAFAKLAGVTETDDWGPASSPHVMQGATAVYMTDGLVSNARSRQTGSSGGKPAGDLTAQEVTECNPDAIIPEPGCEPPPPDGGGGGGGSGGGTISGECDLNAIIPDPACGNETVPDSPPPPVVGEPDYSLMTDPDNPMDYTVGLVVLCTGLTEYPHLSTTPGFAGRINVKARNTCPQPLPSYVSVSLKRQRCFLWIFCGWPTIASGSYSSPSATLAEAKANADCIWKKGWYRAEGYHQVTYPIGVGTARTYGPAYGWAVGITCW